ncbi:MAG: hypothetical protein R2728_13880 [Chitinophagales bacterium]
MATSLDAVSILMLIGIEVDQFDSNFGLFQQNQHVWIKAVFKRKFFLIEALLNFLKA